MEIKPARDVVFPRHAPVVEPLPAPTPSPSPPPPPPSLPPTVLEDRILEIAESMTTPLEPEAVTTTSLEKPEGDEEAPTLWELYSFVTGYKESLSIKKEEDQGFGSERDAESAHNIIQEPATGTERSRVTESGKAIRMSSSPVRQENKAGGSSSYNSSSSDSGSSSSDSDSDSSSGRGSDTGN
ncbi:hypothetical protein HID58_065236 [Brassica napus]|uniref:Uncharacterized protein n=1 Tax=Brassica napus TaxID=3708 RepID=A0ABQ7ZC94_BRANA|nr:hypothetical protein HID58_065234 [Brassica napus]KAH0877842.1 hypothetical protein HID58_065236 [Brassica napus]